MSGFLCTEQSFCLCRYTPHSVGQSSLPQCHRVQAMCPSSRGLLEHPHCWLMGRLHRHISRSARGLGSQPPVKHNINSLVKHLQHVTTVIQHRSANQYALSETDLIINHSIGLAS